MKKTFLILLFILFPASVRAENTNVAFSAAEIMEPILKQCAPATSEKYIPDLELKQLYAQGAACLENQILEQAKFLFNAEKYKNFRSSFTQLSKSYEATIRLLNEEAKDIEFSGTLDRLSTQSQWYNFLIRILEKIAVQRSETSQN